MNRTQKFFDSYAGGFDAIYGTKHSFLNSLINKYLRKSMWLRFEKTMAGIQPVRGKTVLDIGCGPGHYCFYVAKEGAAKVNGIDFAPEMINLAKSRATELDIADKCEFIVGDIYNYSPDEKFDFTIVMGFMDYIAEPLELIKKIVSITKEKVFFSFPCSGGLMALQRKWRYKSRCPLYLYSRKQLDGLFQKANAGNHRIEKISRDYFVSLDIKG